MEDQLQRILDKNRVYLVENLDVDEHFLAYFVTDCIFTVNNVEQINAKCTMGEKAGTFLDILRRRGPNAMEVFLNALQETGQDHIAEKVKADLEEKGEEVPTRSAVDAQTTRVVRDSPDVDINTDSYVDINVQEVDVTSEDFKKKLNDKNVYDVKRKIRGHAVIINNEFFHSGNHREGSQYDMVNLKNLFKELGYETRVHSNKRAAEIKKIIVDESRDPEHGEADSFVLALFLHRAEGIVCGIDGGRVSIEKDIMAPFDGEHCPLLAGKPKLILTQACQGHKRTEGFVVADALPEWEGGRGEMARRDGPVVHKKADMLVAYSTVSDYVSYRDVNKGSWFIRTLVEVFMRRANTDDVVKLLTRVRNEVSQRQIHGYVQMPQDDNTLRKKWYLFPGYKPEAAQ